ncbi:hypothetical protein MMC32_001991 [Xylographa parallela]|nr:hypothetical protein [Xylographa parallela]
MPPRLLSIIERTEPASPTNAHEPPPPLTTTINSQPPTHSPLAIPPSPPLPSPTPHPPKRPLPQQVLALLCLPYRKRPKHPPPPSTPSPHPPPYAPHPPHRRRRTSFDTRYHSFPPPLFTTRGQPRALDTRLYPELLADEDDAPDPDADHRFWSARPQLWAEIAAAQRSDAVPVSPPARAASPPTAKPTPPSETPRSEPAPPPSTAPPHLTLRGGGGPPIRLPDAQRLPPITWCFAGGRGPPPTAGEYRAWRARERARIAEANAECGRKGEEGRGFWREVWWVLVGGRRRRRRRRKGEGEGGEDGDGGSGSAAGGDVSGGGGDGREM